MKKVLFVLGITAALISAPSFASKKEKEAKKSETVETVVVTPTATWKPKVRI